MTPIKRAPFGAVSNTQKTPSSTAKAGVHQHKVSGSGVAGHRKSTTAFPMTPPTGLQFLTVFKCKYYGSGVLGNEESRGPLGSKCTQLVRQVVKANDRQHAQAVLEVTDQGIRLQHKGARLAAEPPMVLDVADLQNVVPGTIKCKNGKQLRIALIVERGDDYDASAKTAFHVIQFRHPDDLRYLAESCKRMWRDHMFTALLDVSTEEGQNAFDSFSIERDIEAVNSRCSKLMESDMFEFERALEGLLN